MNENIYISEEEMWVHVCGRKVPSESLVAEKANVDSRQDVI